MYESTRQVQLTRSSLGRFGFIGEFYDVRTESLSSRSLLKSSYPPKLIECRDIKRMEFDYKFTENISDRFEMLNIEAELQLSVMLGLVKLEGSGKFLKEEKNSQASVSCTLMCKLLNVSEKLFASFDEIIPYIDLTALQDPQYTHVIVEVNWGANCLLSLESLCTSEKEKEEIEGEFKAALSKMKSLLSVNGSGSLAKEDMSSLNKNNIKIKICADVVAENGWPTTVEGFCQFASEIPKLLKNVNNGKGKPLNYVMIPVHTIQKLAKLEMTMDVVVRVIDESFLVSTLYFFEEISEIKKKLCNIIQEIKEWNKYVSDEDFKKTKKQLENLTVKESQLKSLISQDWVLVKSGEKNLKDLIKQIEKFKSHFNLSEYEDFVDSCETIIQKIHNVKSFTSKGIIYLGKGESFEDLLVDHLNSEFIVFLTSSEIEKIDPEHFTNIFYFFLTHAVEPYPNTKYVVVDFDLIKEGGIFKRPDTNAKCCHLKGSEIIKSDLYSEYLDDLTKNFAQLEKGLLTEYAQHKPGNRVILEIICPGFEVGSCDANALKWHCYRCKSYLEYGFNGYFYCSCGRGPASSFEFRCKNPRHGLYFISPSPDLLNKALSQLRPLKELNLLVLGQSGVGKSTWINSIINYLTYDSLDVAKENEVINIIPLSFVFYDAITLKKHVIEMGTANDKEKTDVGASATQYSHTYNFVWDDRCIRIIDTPGLGDTRGIDQDKNNLKNIIEHIGHLKELHGVCILFKANDTRINAYFSYCLKELLAHLHKSVAKNIVFCFTNARSSFYSPGQTSALLEKIIHDLGVENLNLGFHNMFSLDNEAFLFLCSLQKPEIQYDESLVKSFSQSWEISLKETRRLFNTVKTFEPHLLKETISLVTARNRVLSLTKPLAEISKTIQLNVAAMESRNEDLNASELEIQELSQKIVFPQIQLQAVPLKMPRTVCTSASCVRYINYKNIDVSEIEYKTHCHVECYLTNVSPKTVNNALLKNCTAMKNGKCKVCGCGWESHMHLTFSQKRVEIFVKNKKAEEDMLKVITEKEKITNFLNDLKMTVEKYKSEQEIIIKTCVKFGVFLRRNAISLYNDSVEEYLNYLIKGEENKIVRTQTEEALLQKLRETLSHYKAEVQIIEEVTQKGENEVEELSVQDVYDLEQNLYKLELTGEDIRQSVEMSRLAGHTVMDYSETPLTLNRNFNRKSNGTQNQPTERKKFFQYLKLKWT